MKSGCGLSVISRGLRALLLWAALCSLIARPVNAAYTGSAPLLVANGGTGATTFTQHGVIIGEGTSALAVTAVGTNGQMFLGASAADPGWQTMSGDATLGTTGALTLATVNSNVGTFNYATITVNGKGLITAASSGTAAVPTTATASGASPITIAATNLLTTIVSMGSPTASTINLPTAVQTAGFRECVKDGTTNFQTNNATVKSPTSGTIDGVAGATGVVMNQAHQELCFISDSANWFIE